MRDQLRKIIKLIRRTGDRVIIFDNSSPEDTYVAMSLGEYENLIFGRSEVRGLTKNQLLDKINRDIAIWKSEQDYDNLSHFTVDESEEAQSFKKIQEELENRKKDGSKKSNWAIPPNRKNTEEADEEGEQYLEEITF